MRLAIRIYSGRISRAIVGTLGRAFWRLCTPSRNFKGQQDTYRACTGPTAPPGKSFSEAALVVGRRGGKSRVLALIAVFLGCPPSTFRMVICPEAKLRPTNSQVHNLSPPLTPIADFLSAPAALSISMCALNRIERFASPCPLRSPKTIGNEKPSKKSRSTILRSLEGSARNPLRKEPRN
jgi:hypothetical protein